MFPWSELEGKMGHFAGRNSAEVFQRPHGEQPVSVMSSRLLITPVAVAMRLQEPGEHSSIYRSGASLVVWRSVRQTPEWKPSAFLRNVSMMFEQLGETPSPPLVTDLAATVPFLPAFQRDSVRFCSSQVSSST